MYPGSYLIRKSILQEIGGFKDAPRPNWDRLLLLQMASRYRFVFVDKTVIRHRCHKEGRMSEVKIPAVKQGVRYLDYFFEEEGPFNNEILRVKDKVYAGVYLKLLKTAWKEHLYEEYLSYWQKRCSYNRIFFFHPRYLIRAMVSLLMRKTV
jgi:hypothetical protein